MLTPEQLEKLPKKAVAIWRDFDNWIMADICKHIAEVGMIDNQAEYQILIQRFLGKGQKDIEKEIKRRLKLTQKEVKELFENALTMSYLDELEQYSKNGIKIKDLSYLDNLIKVQASQTNEYFANMTNTLGMVLDGTPRTIADAYIHEMDMMYIKVSSGAVSYTQAINQAVSQLVKSNVRVIDYASGVHNNVDVAVRRNIVTSINQGAIKMSEKFIQDNDVEYVEITAHSDARPTHAVWQGKVINYKDLAEVTGYGTAEGLGGVNCRHSFHAFWKGVSTPSPKVDIPTIEVDGQQMTPYDIQQKQRYYERNIRAYKRGLIGAKETLEVAKQNGNNQEIENAQNLVSKYQHLVRTNNKKYRDFSEKANVRIKSERTSTKGYN